MKKLPLLFIFLIQLFFGIHGRAQYFEKTYFDLGMSWFNSMDNTLDSGFIFAGIRNSQPFIAKIKSDGDTLLTKSIIYNSIYGSSTASIVQNAAGNFTLGFTFDSISGTREALFLDLDPALNSYSIVQSFSGFGVSMNLLNLRNSPDKTQQVCLIYVNYLGPQDYVNCGFYYAPCPPTSYFWSNPVSVNNNGAKYFLEAVDYHDTLIFPMHIHNSYGNDLFYSFNFNYKSHICATSDNGAIIIGETQDGIRISKVSSALTVQWQNDILNLDSLQISDIIETRDSGFAIAFVINIFGQNRMGILKVNSSGSLVEFMNVFHDDVSEVYNIKEIENGFALFGRRFSYPYLVKTDANGRIDTAFSITSSAHNYCMGDTCILSTQQAASYLWNTGDTTQSISITQNGMYFVQTTDSIGNQFLSQGFQVTFHPPTSISLGDDTVLCVNQSITLNAGIGFVNYLWQDNSALQTFVATSTTPDTLSYFVQITDSNGCASSDTMQIVYNVCAGINFVDEKETFDLGPNPFTDKIAFHFPHPSTKIITEKVFNYIGEIVYQVESAMQDHELNLSKVQSGIYFIEVVTDKNSVVKKVVKQ